MIKKLIKLLKQNLLQILLIPKIFIIIIKKQIYIVNIIDKLQTNIWELLQECSQELKHDTCDFEYFYENLLNKNLTNFNMKYKSYTNSI